MNKILFTSESVSEGHPDKVSDRISDSILDLYLSKDENSRVAVETLVTTNLVVLAGETRCANKITEKEIEETVRKSIKEIGYEQDGFNWENLAIINKIHSQSADIAMGVDKDGAGDQGIMFGYAKNEKIKDFDTNYMPAAIYISHKILQDLATARHEGTIKGILPDSKSQVTLEYENGKATRAKSILVSTQHEEFLTQEEIKKIIRPIVEKNLPSGWMCEEKDFLVNPTGRFVIGGPDGDSGLTGRKIIVDTYGGYAPHGGGAFSGKDSTKVDRSAAYISRYMAKNIVAAKLADECTIQLSYAIGIAKPLSLYINCNGTNKVDEKELALKISELVDLTPKGIIKHLNLNKAIFTKTSSYGHFGRNPEDNGCFSWEKLDLVDKLKEAFK